MPGIPNKAYTFDHHVGDEGTVTFRCSQDVATWPWLELPPWHSVAMPTINFWVSVECSTARGTFDREKWSALTWMDWRVEDFDAGIPVHGTMESTTIEDKLGFLIALYDDADQLIYTSRGKGVVFRTRDFEGWRSKAKAELRTKVPHADFAFAAAADVGAGPHEFALVSPLRKDTSVFAEALVTAENGLPPNARYLSGTGDHVNATHLCECARQFAALYLGNPSVRFERGEITFSHYVELGVPFRIELLSNVDGEIALAVTQAGTPCTSVTLRPA